MVKRFVLALILAICLIIGFSPTKAEASTLEFSSGFEMGSFVEWVSVTGSPSIDSTVVHTGNYSMRCSGNTIAYAQSATTPYRVTVYIRIGTAPSSNTTIHGYSDAGSAVKLTPDRYIDLYYAGTLKVEGTTQLNLDTWYRISISVEHNGTNYAYYYINGSEEGNAVVGGTVTYSVLGFVTAPGNDAEVFFDNYAVDYVNLAADMSDIRTLRASPNAIGEYAQYDTSSGYTNVDEFPANDADFTEDNGGDLALEAYNIEDTTDIGIGGSDTIEAVRVWIRGDRDGGGGTEHRTLVRDNSIDYASIAWPFDGIAWYSWYHNDLPDGMGDWTQDRFNAFQIGSHHSGGQDQRIHCMVAMVAYKVPAGPCSPNIGNLPITYDFGTVAESSSTGTTINYFTVTNSSGGAVSITIQGTDMTGGVTWTLSDTATPGTNTYGLKCGLDDADDNFDIIVKKNAAYNDLVSGLADSTGQDWGLQLLAPSTTTDGDEKTGTVTLTATCD